MLMIIKVGRKGTIKRIMMIVVEEKLLVAVPFGEGSIYISKRL